MAGRPDRREQLFRGRRTRRLCPRSPYVDPGVIFGSSDGSAAMRLDVHQRWQVELWCARAVAGLPHREELGEPAAVARRERRTDGVERVREGACDLVLTKVLGNLLDVAGACLKRLVLVVVDPPAEHVHRLGLTVEARRQLL
jgi:hypothetical protein